MAIQAGVVYNHTIMSSFESFEESQLQPQVDEIFKDPLTKLVDQRIVLAAFDFLVFFEAEELAQSEVWRAWIKDGHEKEPKQQTILSKIGKFAVGTLETMGRAYLTGAESTNQENGPKPSVSDSTNEETALKEAGLLLARQRIQSAKELMSAIYNLTPKQVKQAEAIARNPQRLNRL